MKKTPLCQSEQVKQYIRQQREGSCCKAGHANEILAPVLQRSGRGRTEGRQGMGEGLIGLDGRGGKIKSKKAVSAGHGP
jgi:hypothetical protein